MSKEILGSRLEGTKLIVETTDVMLDATMTTVRGDVAVMTSRRTNPELDATVGRGALQRVKAQVAAAAAGARENVPRKRAGHDQGNIYVSLILSVRCLFDKTGE